MIPQIPLSARVISALLLLDVSVWLVQGQDDFIITCGRESETYNLYVAPINSDQYTHHQVVTDGVPEDVTYDPIDDKIYWIESSIQQSKGLNGDDTCTISSKICRCNFDGGNQENIVNDLVDVAKTMGMCRATPPKIEIDIQSRQIFWVSTGEHGFPNLRRASMDEVEKGTKVIATSDQTAETTDIYFDPINRKLYWSHSYPAAVQRLNTDGSHVETIIGNEWGISGVAVDVEGDKLFLTVNAGTDLIRTVDLNGRYEEVLYNDTSNHYLNRDPDNPVLYKDNIYWIMVGMGNTERYERDLYTMPKSGRQPATLVDIGLHLKCLYIYHSEDSRSSPDPANNFTSNWIRPNTTAPPHNAPNNHYISDSDIDGLVRQDKSSKENDFFQRHEELIYAGFALLFLVVLSLAILLIILIKKRNKSESRYSSVESIPNHPNVATDSPQEHDGGANIFAEKEVQPKHVKLDKYMGSGVYGVVYEAFLTDNNLQTRVAVKSLKETATREVKERFLDEIKLHIEIGSHPNIISILGCATVSEPYYMIIEFMRYGDLLNFLWKCNKEENIMRDNIYDLRAIDQLYIARQVAQGMEYLSTTRYYHGDLAARNILVGEDLVVKISDFGMADDIYTEGYKRMAPEKKRPLKWVSLETNTKGQCTIKSDVWSYGIVLYEIYTLGGTPYPGMGGQEVIARLQGGYRMEKPENCPDEILLIDIALDGFSYQMMRQCWLECPSERPTFTSLLRTIGQRLRRYSQGGRYIARCTESDNSPVLPGVDEFNNDDDDAFLPSYIQILVPEAQTTSQSRRNRGRITSNEPDEHNLWKHLTKKKTKSNSSNSSVEFIPNMEAGQINFLPDQNRNVYAC